MDTPTHALLPVIAYGLTKFPTLRSSESGGVRSLYRPAAFLALAAALPDLINPHVTLHERWQSWSHGLAAWLAFSLIFLLIAWVGPKWWGWKLALGMSIAYFSHLVGDAIAGGIAWAYPFGDAVIGDYYVTPRWWKPLDIVCIVTAYLIFRVIPWRAAIRRREAALADKRQSVLEEAEKLRSNSSPNP